MTQWATILRERTLSDNTIALRVVACRSFYEFLIRKGQRHDPINPIARGNSGRNGQDPVRGPVGKSRRLPWVPSDPMWKQFMSHVVQQEDARTRAMILLAYDAALRREELMSLRVADIDWEQEIITIRAETTKVGESATFLFRLPFCIWCAPTLRETVVRSSQRMIRPDPALIFLSESTRNPGHPLSVGAFDEIVERVRTKLGMHALTPHTLRHQRCTILKRAGVSLEDIALLAGHKSTETTLLYIHLFPEALSQRIRAKVEFFDAPIRQLVEQAMKREGSHEE